MLAQKKDVLKMAEAQLEDEIKGIKEYEAFIALIDKSVLKNNLKEVLKDFIYPIIEQEKQHRNTMADIAAVLIKNIAKEKALKEKGNEEDTGV